MGWRVGGLYIRGRESVLGLLHEGQQALCGVCFLLSLPAWSPSANETTAFMSLLAKYSVDCRVEGLDCYAATRYTQLLERLWLVCFPVRGQCHV